MFGDALGNHSFRGKVAYCIFFLETGLEVPHRAMQFKNSGTFPESVLGTLYPPPGLQGRPHLGRSFIPVGEHVQMDASLVSTLVYLLRYLGTYQVVGTHPT